eukprot:jgi/Phyca11/115312/e_gw1.28.236.1
MDDWTDKDAQRKEEQTAKQRGIEESGVLLRRLAMGEIRLEKKISKRERLDVVSNGITSALLGASEEDKAKYDYKTKRLQFEREQEEKKRDHASQEAEKRRAHELQLEDRRLKADEARDKRMQEFILKIMEQQKK